MMAVVFQTRDRNQIKNKFNREDHKNRDKIDLALGRGKKYIKAMEGRFNAQPSSNIQTQPDLYGEEAETELMPICGIGHTSSTSSIDSVDMVKYLFELALAYSNIH